MATDDKVSVILTSTNTSGAVKQKSFTYISPDATNSELKAFAQAANALTENTYNGSKKVTQVNLDTATDKLTPTISLSKTSCSLSDLRDSGTAASAQHKAGSAENDQKGNNKIDCGKGCFSCVV